MKKRLSFLLKSIVLLLISGQLLHAQVLQQTIFPDNLTLALRFGHDIEVEGNTMVVTDRGYKPSGPGSTCGSIDDGAIHIYKRASASQPWPTSPAQTIVSTTREGHFGQYVILRGNSLIVSEERALLDGTRTGCFKYFSRPDVNSSFVLTDTEFSPVSGSDYPRAGLTSNGKYVVAASQSAPPNLHVYKINPSSVDLLYSFSGIYPFFGDQMVLTNNDMLVISKANTNTVRLVQLTDAGATDIGSSGLTLTNPGSQTNNVYTGTVAVHANEVVLTAQGQLSGNTFYYLKTFNLSTGTAQGIKTISFPALFTSANGYSFGPGSLTIKDKDALFVTFRKQGRSMNTLGFKYFSGTASYNYFGEVNMRDFDPQAGNNTFLDNNYYMGLAYDGELLYIGHTFDQTNIGAVPQGCSTPQGSVRIFNPSEPITVTGNITKFANIFPDGNGNPDQYGCSVSIQGDYLLAGQLSDDDLPINFDGIGRNNGAAYLYKKVNGQWQQMTKFLDLNGNAFRLMGSSVAINDQHLIVSIPGDPVPNTSFVTSGSVVTATKVNGEFEVNPISNKLFPPDNQNNANFGSDISLSSNTLAVGAPEFGGSDDDGGSVYMYDWNGSAWVFSQKIIASDVQPLASEQFGTSVSVDGDKMIVGAIRKNGVGAVYFFRKNGSTWTQTGKFVPSELSGTAGFGTQVAISQNYAVASAPQSNANAGFVQFYHFDGSNWQKDLTVPGTSGQASLMGQALAIEDTKAVVVSSILNKVDRYELQGNTWVRTNSMTLPGEVSAFNWDADISNGQVAIGKGGETFDGFSQAGSVYLLDFANIVSPFELNLAVVNEWNEGATIQATLKNNTAQALNNWTVGFDLQNATVSQLWDGSFTQSGTLITVSNLGYNATIPAGGSVTFGFNVIKSGTLTFPASGTLNNSSIPVTGTGGDGSQNPDPSNVQVNLVVSNQWSTGATIDVSITNQNAQSINGWNIVFSIPNATVTNSWNADVAANGSSFSFTNKNYNSTIGANSTVSFGFNIDKTGSLVLPSSGTFNGVNVLINSSGARIGLLEENLTGTIANGSLFPNPASGEYVFLRNNYTGTVIVYDLLGHETNQLTVEDNKINISSLQKGVYFFSITQQDGTVVKQKFIKN